MTSSVSQGKMAFVHDAKEVRYQFYTNCDMLEVASSAGHAKLV